MFSYLYLTNKMALDKVFYDKYDFDVWRMNLEGYTNDNMQPSMQHIVKQKILISGEGRCS